MSQEQIPMPYEIQSAFDALMKAADWAYMESSDDDDSERVANMQTFNIPAQRLMFWFYENEAALAAERRKVERLREALTGIAKETHPALVMSLSDAYAYKVAVGIARAALQDEQQGETV